MIKAQILEEELKLKTNTHLFDRKNLVNLQIALSIIRMDKT
jgi:hypothetical protein